MSNKRLTAVWDHSKQKGVKLLALLSLADRSDDDGFCWPSQNDTAHRARSKRSYVVTIIRDIELDGEIYIHPRPGTTNQYLVLPGMTFRLISNAMKRRFRYTDKEITEKILAIAKMNGVSTADMSVLLDTQVSVERTPGVCSTGHEPSVNPQKNHHNGDHDFFANLAEEKIIEPTDDDKKRRQLSDAFYTLSQIPQPNPGSRGYTDWMDGIDRLMKIESTVSEMENAKAILDEAGYTYNSPGSFVRTIVNMRKTNQAKKEPGHLRML